MDCLLIDFKLDAEFFFPKYNDYRLRKEEKKLEIIRVIDQIGSTAFLFSKNYDYILRKEEKQLEIGDTVQIGSVECKIIEKLENDNYKLEVINTLPAQFVNCIQCLIDENYEIYTSLIDNVSCKEEEVECEFYINKNISLIILSRQLRYKNNLKKCSSCSEYFNLDAKYVSDDAKYVPDDGKDFCSYNCNESFALSQDQIF